MTSRIKFHRKPEAPSIPMPGQAYGYEECEDGTLKKQDPPDRDISIGPAFYKPAVVSKTVNALPKILYGRLRNTNSTEYICSIVKFIRDKKNM